MTPPIPHLEQRSAGTATTFDDVAVMAAGTIGVSWTALFLAHGLHVRVFATRPGLKDYVVSSLEQISPTLTALGLPTDDLTARLDIADSLADAVDGAKVVQENGPENLGVKHSMLAGIEAATAPDTLIPSSTSALPATQMASALTHPERLLVAHPFNPPHVIPLVEVPPGERTDADAVTRVISFYQARSEAELESARDGGQLAILNALGSVRSNGG